MKKSYLSGLRISDGRFIKRRINKKLSGNPKVSDHTKVFQEDISRIISSAGFRRLQNKTQVHPLPNSDYYRNRLTHSLEVSEIGQLIANAVGIHLSENDKLPKGISSADIKDIVASACLIHDIGNPPFGHNGEEAIQCWFQGNQDLKIVKEAFKCKKTKKDFLNFDGNAQGFRVANHLLTWRENGGLRLSLAAVGASIKYPWSAFEAKSRIGKKKFGYMRCDKHTFERIFSKLKLKRKDGSYFRHPLAYIVEAADDIAYLTTDIEDGVKSKSISFKIGRKLLEACTDKFHSPRLEHIDKRDKDSIIGYLARAAASTMVDCAFLTFVDERNYKKIQDGTFIGSLLENSRFEKEIDAIRSECKKNLYTRTDKLEVEAGGHYMIEKVLGILMETANEYFICDRSVSKMRKKYRNIYYLLPEEIRLYRFRTDDAESLCYKMVDHVAGMTDNHIVRVYRTLFAQRDYFS